MYFPPSSSIAYPPQSIVRSLLSTGNGYKHDICAHVPSGPGGRRNYSGLFLVSTSCNRFGTRLCHRSQGILRFIKTPNRSHRWEL